MIDENDTQLIPEDNQQAIPVTQTPPTPDIANQIADAEKAGNQQRFYANLLRSFQNMLQNSAPKTGYKADMGVADSMEKQADQPLNDLKLRMAQEAAAKKQAMEAEKFKMEKETHASKMKSEQMQQDDFQMRLAKSKLDFTDMQANRDPQSAQSKLAQDRVIELYSMRGTPLSEQQQQNIRQQPGETLYKLEPQLQKDLVEYYKNIRANQALQQKDRHDQAMEKKADAQMEMWRTMENRRQQNAERIQKDQVRREKRDLSKDITSRYDKLKGDKLYVELQKQGLAFDQADELVKQIESGNEIAMGALGTKMARAMGEVGVLTDSDVQRYIQAQSLIQKMKDKFGKNFMGHVSQTTLKDIKEVTAKMKEGFKTKKNALVDEYVNQTYENFGRDAGMSRDELMQRFGLGSKAPVSAAPYGETVNRNGKLYKWNSGVGKYQPVSVMGEPVSEPPALPKEESSAMPTEDEGE